MPEQDYTPTGRDTLARMLALLDVPNIGWDAWGYTQRDSYRRDADVILSSDWLAGVRREVAERCAQIAERLAVADHEVRTVNRAADAIRAEFGLSAEPPGWPAVDVPAAPEPGSVSVADLINPYSDQGGVTSREAYSAWTAEPSVKLDPTPYVSARGVRYAIGALYFGDSPLAFAPRAELGYSTDPADYGIGGAQ